MKSRRVLCILGLMVSVVIGANTSNTVVAEDSIKVIDVRLTAGVPSILGEVTEEKAELVVGVQGILGKYMVESTAIGILPNTVPVVQMMPEEKFTGYATTCVNVREQPNTECGVLGNYNFNDSFEYSVVNEEWVKVTYNDSVGYVFREYVSDTKQEYRIVNVPSHRDFKSYMGYNCIKSWYQKDLQGIAYTGDYGIRMYDGRYCVAVGTACNAQVGDYGALVLENGVEIPIVIGDIKADRDTDSNNLVTSANGCVSEFIVDKSLLPYAVRNSDGTGSGSISSCKEEWQSPVIQIKIFDGMNCLGL